MIPFFGDQAFWGSAVFRRGVGPKPIPIDSLTTKKLVEALLFMQKPEVKQEARMRLARFEFANGMYPEALGILEVSRGPGCITEDVGGKKAIGQGITR